VGDTALDVYTVKLRPRTIRIGCEIHERPPIQKHRITYESIVVGNSFRASAGGSNAPDVHFVR
jgi:hypothetical protein